MNYGWWTKSCTTKDDDYPIVYRVLTINSITKKQEGFRLGFPIHQNVKMSMLVVTVLHHGGASQAILVTSTYQPNLTWARKKKTGSLLSIGSTGCLFGILISCFMKNHHHITGQDFISPYSYKTTVRALFSLFTMLFLNNWGYLEVQDTGCNWLYVGL